MDGEFAAAFTSMHLRPRILRRLLPTSAELRSLEWMDTHSRAQFRSNPRFRSPQPPRLPNIPNKVFHMGDENSAPCTSFFGCEIGSPVKLCLHELAGRG